jgi:hypothetical protein
MRGLATAQKLHILRVMKVIRIAFRSAEILCGALGLFILARVFFMADWTPEIPLGFGLIWEWGDLTGQEALQIKFILFGMILIAVPIVSKLLRR